MQTLFDRFGVTEGQMLDNILSTWARATSDDMAKGRDWYSEAAAAALHVGKIALPGAHPMTQRRLGAAYLAAFSPRTGWGRTVALAYAFATGQEVKFLTALVKQATNARRLAKLGHNPIDAISGKKIRAFALTIAGDDAPAVVDVWALGVLLARRASVTEQKKVQSGMVYEQLAAIYQAAADILGVPVQVVQATTWVTYRRECDGDWRDEA